MDKQPFTNTEIPDEATSIRMPIALSSAGLAHNIAFEIGGQLSVDGAHLNITTDQPVQIVDRVRDYLLGLVESGINIQFNCSV